MSESENGDGSLPFTIHRSLSPFFLPLSQPSGESAAGEIEMRWIDGDWVMEKGGNCAPGSISMTGRSRSKRLSLPGKIERYHRLGLTGPFFDS